MLNKLEKKLSKFAVRNLMLYIIGGYILGYIISFASQRSGVNYLSYMTLEPYFIIHKFQLWRLLSWVMIPPTSGLFFVLIMCLLYYQLGNALERSWGVFRFNVYIFGGIIFTIIGAFALYGFTVLTTGNPVVGIGNYVSTYYINMSIFLAFAMSFPNMMIMLYFIIPVKMKWMAAIYGVMIVYEFALGTVVDRVMIACSLANFLVFLLMSRDLSRFNPKQVKRKADFKRSYNAGVKDAQFKEASAAAQAQSSTAGVRHKCVICGATEKSHPDRDFRYCSKCSGGKEYCSEHLWTHTHN